MNLLHAALLAVEFDTTPVQPPGFEGLVKILGWISWGVSAALIAAVLVSGGKFAWERHQTGVTEAPKMLLGALIGAVIAGGAGTILNAIAPS